MSIVYSAIGVTVNVLMTILFAYPLSRSELPGKNFLSLMLFFPMLFNGGLVPTYLVYTNILNVKDSIWGMIIPYLLFNPFLVIMMRTYFTSSIPNEVIEAAKIDGCNTLKTLWYVIVPMLKPSLVSCALFQFMWTNNDFQGPLIYIADMQKYTNSVYLRMSMDGDVGFQWNRILAMSLISIVPSLIVFFCAQDSFIDGIAAGGVKG